MGVHSDVTMGVHSDVTMGVHSDVTMGVHPEHLAEVRCVTTLTGQVTLFKIRLHFLRKLKLLLPVTL